MLNQPAIASRLDYFHAFIRWGLVITLGSLPFYIMSAIVWRIPLLWIMAVVCALAGITLEFVRRILRDGQLGLGAALTFVVMLVNSVFTVGVFPIFATTILLLLAAVFIVILPIVDRKNLLWMLLGIIMTSVLLVLIERYATWGMLFPVPLDGVLRVFGIAVGVILLGVAIWYYHHHLLDVFQQLQQTHQILNTASVDLGRQVAERTASLRQALADVEERAAQESRLRHELELQRETIRELSVPVLPVFHDTLVMPLVGVLDGTRLQQMQDQALSSLEQTHARRLLIDITGVPIVDTHVAQGLMQVINATRLLGAQVSLIGVRPEVAQTLVSLGIDMRGVQAISDLQAALAMYRR